MDEEKKNNKKQKVSIITVFLWMLLIVTMSVITIGSIYKQNAVEDLIDKVSIKLDMSEIDDEVLDMYTSILEENEFIFAETNSGMENINFIQKENKIYTYELENVPLEDITLYLGIFDYYENDTLLENKSIYSSRVYYKEIKLEELKSEYIFQAKGEKIEINIKGGNVSGIMLFDQESINIPSSGGMLNIASVVSSLVSGNYENDEIRYVGIKNKLAKSIVIASGYEIYEQDTLLTNLGSGYYIKDLTNSNEYFFNMEVERGTVFRFKIEGMPFEEAIEKMNLRNINLWTENDEEIDLGDMHGMILNQEAQIIFPNYITQDGKILEIFCDNTVFYIENNGERICSNMPIELDKFEIKLNEYNEFNLIARVFSDEEINEMDPDTYAIEQIKWSDKNTGKAEIVLGNTSTYDDYSEESFYIGDDIYIQEALGDDFVLSSEYENNTRWKIIDSILDESEILNLFDENIAIKYIYVKDRNTIYWKYNISDVWTQSEPIYVYYKNYDIVNAKREILTSHKSNILETFDGCLAELKSPELGFKHTEERNIMVQKFDEDGVYYVGLYKNNILSKIEKIDVVNDRGSVQISIEDYDENASYAIYEVDKEGNQIEEKEYLVEFLDKYDIRNTEITSDKTIVSSVKSGIVNSDKYKNTATIEESEGTGEADYVDNMLSVKDIYQAKVTIGEEKVHKVTYETEEGGKLEGETEEYVKDGETPEKVPTPVPDDGYEFDKWVIVENGEEVEVDPNTYVPTKDVTFIAKFKKIDKIVDIDTSDIQVWVYVVVAIVAVVGIVVVVLIVRKNKTRK